MSIENAQAFLQRITSDEAFLNSIKNCENDEERAALIKDVGFEFSTQELMSIVPKDLLTNELTDEQLEAVNGGSFFDAFFGSYVNGTGVTDITKGVSDIAHGNIGRGAVSIFRGATQGIPSPLKPITIGLGAVSDARNEN